MVSTSKFLKMEIENWYPVKGYERYYQITKSGKVRSLHNRNRYYIMEQRIDRAGYYTVRLHRNHDKGSTRTVHRLLAMTFIENPENKCCVNHLDGNKLNNSLDNLEWNTHSENCKHAYQLGLTNIQAKSKPVIDNCTGSVYKTIQIAAESSGINRKTLTGYLNGYRTNPTCMEYLKAA